jgi:hypothetical protein
MKQETRVFGTKDDKSFWSDKPKQETLEEAAANLADPNICKTDNWIAGAKYQASLMYSEEEVLEILYQLKLEMQTDNDFTFMKVDDWFEQFKKK